MVPVPVFFPLRRCRPWLETSCRRGFKEQNGMDEAMVYREIRYGIPRVYLCCTIGAPVLHFLCQGAALLLALLFVSLYSGFSVGQIRQISWSSDYNSYANICFFRTRIARIWRIFLGCDMIYIRGIREICGQLNIIHTRICFSNTNCTNLTNLLGCDPVYIRGIREITSLWSVGLRQISWST